MSLDVLTRAIRWLAGFAEVHAPQSMTRLCALVFALTGATCGVTGALVAVLAFHAGKYDGVADLIKALAVLATVFVASGAVALLSRSKPSSGGTS
jgi:L-cysteine desulfidase